MKEEFFDAGTELVAHGEKCPSVMFVVQGKIDLKVIDKSGEKFLLQSLKQGDMLGQYSVLFDEPLLFTAHAVSNLRILTIDQSFFMEYKDTINGLEDAIYEAETHVEDYGMPLCDFKLFATVSSPLKRFRRAVKHVIILNKSNKSSKSKFMEILSEVQSNVKKDMRRKMKDIQKEIRKKMIR